MPESEGLTLYARTGGFNRLAGILVEIGRFQEPITIS
jgi:hypothetical protein